MLKDAAQNHESKKEKERKYDNRLKLRKRVKTAKELGTIRGGNEGSSGKEQKRVKMSKRN